MENLKITDYILIVLGLWFALLNIYLFKTVRTYRKLTKGSQNINLEAVLDKIIKNLENGDKRISQLTEMIAKFENLNSSNFQKLEIMRFNPFEDSGGDQSFVAALLDGKNNGLVISSLHSRNGTRVYAKQIASGKAAAHQLSKEEAQVVEKAAQKS